MLLNLDPTYAPLGLDDTIQYKSFTFNGGEPHIIIEEGIPFHEKVVITHRIHTFNDMGLLLVAVDALQRMQVRDIELYLPYFPGARQDRVMQKGEPLTVKVYANLLNQCAFTKVYIVDPHSDVVAALVDNIVVLTNHRFIAQVMTYLPNDTLLVSPDAGATKKIYSLAAYLDISTVIECSKKRDVRTGKLSSFQVYANNLNGQSCLIVDDICDGGGTFLGLAKALKEKGAGDICLATTHAMFSKGVEALQQQFTTIFTTDSFAHNQDVVVIANQNKD